LVVHTRRLAVQGSKAAKSRHCGYGDFADYALCKKVSILLVLLAGSWQRSAPCYKRRIVDYGKKLRERVVLVRIKKTGFSVVYIVNGSNHLKLAAVTAPQLS
jgi:hypothetical protein